MPIINIDGEKYVVSYGCDSDFWGSAKIIENAEDSYIPYAGYEDVVQKIYDELKKENSYELNKENI